MKYKCGWEFVILGFCCVTWARVSRERLFRNELLVLIHHEIQTQSFRNYQFILFHQCSIDTPLYLRIFGLKGIQIVRCVGIFIGRKSQATAYSFSNSSMFLVIVLHTHLLGSLFQGLKMKLLRLGELIDFGPIERKWKTSWQVIGVC